MPKQVSPANMRTLASFRYALRQFLHFSEAAAGEVGLTPQQHQALLAIEGFNGPEPVTVGMLAQRLQIRHHSAVGLVDRLVRKSLVKRSRDSDDRRKVILTVTRRGGNLLHRLSTTHREELKRIGPELIKQLQALLS